MATACARLGCSNAGTVRIELHDERVPYSVWCCWAHQSELIALDRCQIDDCDRRSVRLKRCPEHLGLEDGEMPIRDQILLALCPPNTEGVREPLPNGLSFGELIVLIPRNRTSVARALTALREDHLVIRAGDPSPRWYATGAPEMPVVRETRLTLSALLATLGAPAELPTAPLSLLAKRVAEASATAVRTLNATIDERTDQRDDALDRVATLESQLAAAASAKSEAEGGYRAGYRDGHRDGVSQRINA